MRGLKVVLLGAQLDEGVSPAQAGTEGTDSATLWPIAFIRPANAGTNGWSRRTNLPSRALEFFRTARRWCLGGTAYPALLGFKEDPDAAEHPGGVIHDANPARAGIEGFDPRAGGELPVPPRMRGDFRWIAAPIAGAKQSAPLCGDFST